MGKYRHQPTPGQTTPFFTRTTNMPRRMKLISLLLALAGITLLLYTFSARTSSPSFYSSTVDALAKGQSNAKNILEDEAVARQMKKSLEEAAQKAKNNANAKSPKPDPPSELVGKGSAAEGAERSVAGRKKYGGGGLAEGEQKVVVPETMEEHEIEVELNSILKKSPIIIFSKSYCPHSKRAKGILLEKYIIDPAPYVVELDVHPIGLGIQARLADLTNRRTVPNVLINGISIGGGDDVAALDSSHTLIDKIKELGGKKMLDVRLRLIVDENHGLK